MNRFERTHEELKRQLASLGIYDSDCPIEISLNMKEEAETADKVQNPLIIENKIEEQRADAKLAAS